jgi:vacuolar-type H+-ATPase subunit F/Vma7
VIGDKDTVLGFSLAGAEGTEVGTSEEAQEALDSALGREDIELLLITYEWSAPLRERIDKLLMNSIDPVVMEIPGKEMQSPGESVEELVRRAVGISI